MAEVQLDAWLSHYATLSLSLAILSLSMFVGVMARIFGNSQQGYVSSPYDWHNSESACDACHCHTAVLMYYQLTPTVQAMHSAHS